MRSRNIPVGLLAIGFLAIAATSFGQPVSNGQEAKIHGLITGRNGAEMTVETQDGTNVTVELTDSTKVEEKQGKLGLRKKEMAVMGLIPGLRVDVHGVGDAQGRLVASGVSFSAKDLETAHAIQAGLNPTEQQVAATAGKVDANKQAIQAVSGEEAALSKRFGELGDYDVKAESEVFFAVGKADLSAQGKSDLDALAQKAQALKGYLIQVQGFADASGSREGACE